MRATNFEAQWHHRGSNDATTTISVRSAPTRELRRQAWRKQFFSVAGPRSGVDSPRQLPGGSDIGTWHEVACMFFLIRWCCSRRRRRVFVSAAAGPCSRRRQRDSSPLGAGPQIRPIVDGHCSQSQLEDIQDNENKPSDASAARLCSTAEGSKRRGLQTLSYRTIRSEPADFSLHVFDRGHTSPQVQHSVSNHCWTD